MGNVYTRFQTKTRKNPTRWDGTYPYGLYKGVAPPGATAAATTATTAPINCVLLLLCAISASTLLLLPLTTTTATATSAPVTTNTYATGDLKVTLQ